MKNITREKDRKKEPFRNGLSGHHAVRGPLLSLVHTRNFKRYFDLPN
jgi:hypothetical protein